MKKLLFFICMPLHIITMEKQREEPSYFSKFLDLIYSIPPASGKRQKSFSQEFPYFSHVLDIMAAKQVFQSRIIWTYDKKKHLDTFGSVARKITIIQVLITSQQQFDQFFENMKQQQFSPETIKTLLEVSKAMNARKVYHISSKECTIVHKHWPSCMQKLAEEYLCSEMPFELIPKQ